MLIESHEESLSLSSYALAALTEFQEEEKDRAKKFQQLAEETDENFHNSRFETPIDAFKEDWQLSQFWYTNNSAEKIGRALIDGADENTVIAIASTPSVYAAIKKFPKDQIPTEHIYLLEYDTRFEALAGKSHFRFYDYEEPESTPEDLRFKCHRLLVDPPFFDEKCQKKSAEVAKKLIIPDKSTVTKKGDKSYKLIASTGERVRDLVHENYPDTRITNFIPEHKNGLSNEYRCYANFECREWRFATSKDQV